MEPGPQTIASIQMSIAAAFNFMNLRPTPSLMSPMKMKQ